MQRHSEMSENYRWNMNAAFMQQLDERRNDKAKAAIEGDVWNWYRCNIEIWSTIQPLVETIEKGKKPKEAIVVTKLREVKVLLQTPENKNLHAAFKKTGKVQKLGKAELLLQEIDREIMSLMFKHQLIYIKPKKKTVEGYMAEDDNYV